MVGIKVFIQGWQGRSTKSVHLLSTDIAQFAVDIRDTPDGKPEVRPLEDERVASSLVRGRHGCWLDKPVTETWP